MKPVDDPALAALHDAHVEAWLAWTGAKDFYAYLPSHRHIFTPTREPWPAARVNEKLGWICRVKAARWLDRNRSVEQMTWMPGAPMVVSDRLVSDGGWVAQKGCST